MDVLVRTKGMRVAALALLAGLVALPLQSASAAPLATPANNRLTDHGGPVLTAPTVYPIFYGSWTSAQETLVDDFLTGVSGSSWFSITGQYVNPTRTTAPTFTLAAPFLIAGGTTSTGYYGKSLTDARITKITEYAYEKQLPTSSQQIYLVLTSAGIKEAGFGTEFCGWHADVDIKQGTTSVPVTYAFVGNPGGVAATLRDCAPTMNDKASPNNAPGVDAMINNLAGQLADMVTDPDLNAWYDGQGNEISAKCMASFGTTHSAGTGHGVYNITLDKHKFLIQELWSNAKANHANPSGTCVMSYPPSTP